MQLGVFAKSFPCDSIESNLDAVVRCGFTCTQYNMTCAGLPTLPNELSAELCRRIAVAHADRGLTMVAISGTFNIIDDNDTRLADNITRLRVLAENCASLGTKSITLCSGSCDSDNMWRWHPENASQTAWQRMLTSLRSIVEIAAAHNLYVAIEPEINNVVDSARKARGVLDEIGSPHLKIVLDAANLFTTAEISQGRRIIGDAIDLLASDLIFCHAKELVNPDIHGEHRGRLGEGLLDFDYYLYALRNAGFTGPLIVHGVAAEDLPSAQRLLTSALANSAAAMANEA